MSRKHCVWFAAAFVEVLVLAICVPWIRSRFVDPSADAHAGGMAAAGDAVAFVLLSAAFASLPLAFLLRHWAGARPRGLAWGLLALSATGPLCWSMLSEVEAFATFVPSAMKNLVGLALVLLIGPRAVASPFVLTWLTLSFFFVSDRRSRLIVLSGVLLEATPLILVVVHLLRATGAD